MVEGLYSPHYNYISYSCYEAFTLFFAQKFLHPVVTTVKLWIVYIGSSYLPYVWVSWKLTC